MPHVLVADDDPVQSAVYTRVLEERGFTTRVAASPAEARTAVAQKVPDAVLIDLGLPDDGCIGLILELRGAPACRSTRVWVLSNAYLEIEALAAWEAGASQVLSKATHPPERIRDLLLVEFGLSAPPTGPCDAVDPARAEFLLRAAGYIRTCRDELDAETSGDGRGGSLDRTAAALRRLQAAQAFGIPAIPQLAAVSEWLTRALLAWPSSLGPSSTRTLCQALDAIERRIDAPAAPVRDLQTCRVLGVDDEPTSRLLLQQAFRKIRVPCDLAPGGEAALAAAAATQYDLVVTDVDMPGMDGFDLVSRLRATPGYASVPILFVTALEGFEQAFAHDHRGGMDAIVKPYLIMELATKAVATLLGGPPA